MEIETGRVEFWAGVKETLSDSVLTDALERHRRGDHGTLAPELRAPDEPISKFHSGHVDINGQRFGVYTCIEDGELQTHVYLRNQ